MFGSVHNFKTNNCPFIEASNSFHWKLEKNVSYIWQLHYPTIVAKQICQIRPFSCKKNVNFFPRSYILVSSQPTSVWNSTWIWLVPISKYSASKRRLFSKRLLIILTTFTTFFKTAIESLEILSDAKASRWMKQWPQLTNHQFYMLHNLGCQSSHQVELQNPRLTVTDEQAWFPNTL